MAFGKSFETLKEARQHLEKVHNPFSGDQAVRKLSKKAFPRRKKRYHVGTYMDYLNFT